MRARIAILALAVVSMLALAANAGAKTVELHSFSTSFTGSDAVGAPEFPSNLEKLDVDKATGDVYVGAQNFIYKVDSSGVSQPFSALAPKTVLAAGLGIGFVGTLAVDNAGGSTQGRIYTFEEFHPMSGFLTNGEPIGGLFPVAGTGDLCGVAVDSGGHIWRQTYGGPLSEYNADGSPTGQEVELEGSHSFCTFEMDSQGDFYAPSSYAGGPVSEYAPDGTLIQHLGGSPAIDVAVDRSTGDIYLDIGTTIEHYTAAGEFVEDLGELTSSYGVAVDPNTHAVYAIDNVSPGSVAKFTSSGTVSVAGVATEAPTDLTRTGAAIHGTVSPEGIATTDCRFEYGPAVSNSFSQSVPCAEGNVFNGSSGSSVSAAIAGGEAETEYQYRLRVTNANGPSYGTVKTFKTFGAVKATETEEATEIDATHATLHGSFDPDGLDTHYWFVYGTDFGFEFQQPSPGPPGADAGSTAGLIHVSAALSGLEAGTSAAGKEYQFMLVAENETGKTFGEVLTFNTPPAVKSVSTGAGTELSLTSATFNGSFDPDGEDTHYYFEYGATASYGRFAPAGAPPGEDGGSVAGVKAVSQHVTGLEAGSTVHFRIVAVNSKGTTVGSDKTVKLGQAPIISGDRATDINTDHALLEATVNPAGRATAYHWEYGLEDCSVATCEQSDPASIPAGNGPVPVSFTLEDLEPGSVYHFRLITSNPLGETVGEDHPFLTYAAESGADTCSNLLERKQTGAAATRHCRAYELVSAANTGGYDVESNLIAGLHPMPGFPNAGGKVLYSLRFGAIPGSGNPPNKGGDPYVATRGADGWTTRYVGLQADGTESAVPFASTLLEADQGLSSFAFGGPEICDPCFADGSSNIPLRLPDGELVKGMAGAENPAADPAGEIAKHFSADGSHFVFGSTAKFEPSGNGGSVSIYERDLKAGTTEVVSTLPDGTNLPGAGTAELDISSNGSRVLIGQEVGDDAAGNPEYDLYMHMAGNPKSVLVAEPAGGALYAGMTQDGSQVYFTTGAALADDADTSADLYRADVSPAGAAVTRISTGEGGAGNGNGCDPVANSAGNHWNEPGSASAATCGVVAIAGGGGVAGANGAVYFLSPELLAGAGNGVADRPNLYVAMPDQAPAFVATLDPDNPLVRDSVATVGRRETADFQTTSDGTFALFGNGSALTTNTTAGHAEIYRSEVGGGLDCVSCLPSNGAPTTDTFLTKGGINLIADGRVAFTSSEQLVLRDTNRLEDAYEWDAGTTALISTGLDTNDSGLLTVSADGRDVFFFTRQSLAPQDENGGAMKIYDAREGGGFLFNPPPRECVASDECHGAGSQEAAPPAIGTIEGKGEQLPPESEATTKPKRCRKGQVKRNGKCVKPHKKKHHPKRHSRGKEQHHG